MANNNSGGRHVHGKLHKALKFVLVDLLGFGGLLIALRRPIRSIGDIARLTQIKEANLQAYSDISDTKHLRVEAERLRQPGELVRFQNVD